MLQHNLTLRDILQLRARQQPEQIAYIYLEGDGLAELPITYAELDRRARAIAALIQRSCQPGDRAILLYPQGLEFIAAFFGCLYAGVIAVPAYPPRANRNLSRLRAIVADCRAVLALSTDQLARSIQTSSEASELDRLCWVATDVLEAHLEDGWVEPSHDDEALAFLQYTSGSTGTPKGVMVSHRNLIHNSQCIRDRWNHSTRSLGVSWLPQFHDLGLIIGLLQPIYVGYQAVFLSPIGFIQKPYRWLDVISRYRGTTTCGPNFAFDLCVLKVTPEQRQTLDLSCLETVMNGAEPVLAATLDNFTHAFSPCGFRRTAFRGGYGLAEGTVFVTTSHRCPGGPNVKTLHKAAVEQNQVVEVTDQSRDSQDIVSCGPTADDQELVIVKPDLCARCDPGQIGEIWVKGPSVARGYWQRPEESARTFEAVLEGTDEGPFLRTGDLGFLDDGELYITGRIKDLIIVRGRNHYPQDLERTVERVHPALRLNCTAAFSLRDHGEERVVVVQELRRDHANVDLEQLLGEMFQSVAEDHELSLHAIALIAEGDISKTSSGKIQRAVCKQRYLDGDFKIVRQATFAISPGQPALDSAGFVTRFAELDAEECRAQMESYLVRTLRTVSPGLFYVDVHVSLVRLGLDSLGVADLKAAVDRDLGISISPVTLMETSLGDLSGEIIRQLTAKDPSGERAGAAMQKRVDELSDAEVNTLLDEMLSPAGTTDG